MPYTVEHTKKALTEIVDALECIIEKNSPECNPTIKKSLHRFCEIARETEKRVKKEEPSYEISRFLGASAYDREKMGWVCNCEETFPSCRKAHPLWATNIDEYFKETSKCAEEVRKAIREHPVEQCEDYHSLVRSLEVMRDWMHMQGYNLPDYVWVTPKKLRGQVKTAFDRLSSTEIQSTADLKKLKKEIEEW